MADKTSYSKPARSATYLLFHSFSKYLRTIYCVPGTVLGAAATALTNRSPCPHEAYSPLGSETKK